MSRLICAPDKSLTKKFPDVNKKIHSWGLTHNSCSSTKNKKPEVCYMCLGMHQHRLTVTFKGTINHLAFESEYTSRRTRPNACAPRPIDYAASTAQAVIRITALVAARA
jgi:hypothetical protein